MDRNQEKEQIDLELKELAKKQAELKLKKVNLEIEDLEENIEENSQDGGSALDLLWALQVGMPELERKQKYYEKQAGIKIEKPIEKPVEKPVEKPLEAEGTKPIEKPLEAEELRTLNKSELLEFKIRAMAANTLRHCQEDEKRPEIDKFTSMMIGGKIVGDTLSRNKEILTWSKDVNEIFRKADFTELSKVELKDIAKDSNLELPKNADMKNFRDSEEYKRVREDIKENEKFVISQFDDKVKSIAGTNVTEVEEKIISNIKQGVASNRMTALYKLGIDLSLTSDYEYYAAVKEGKEELPDEKTHHNYRLAIENPEKGLSKRKINDNEKDDLKLYNKVIKANINDPERSESLTAEELSNILMDTAEKKILSMQKEGDIQLILKAQDIKKPKDASLKESLKARKDERKLRREYNKEHGTNYSKEEFADLIYTLKREFKEAEKILNTLEPIEGKQAVIDEITPENFEENKNVIKAEFGKMTQDRIRFKSELPKNLDDAYDGRAIGGTDVLVHVDILTEFMKDYGFKVKEIEEKGYNRDGVEKTYFTEVMSKDDKEVLSNEVMIVQEEFVPSLLKEREELLNDDRVKEANEQRQAVIDSTKEMEKILDQSFEIFDVKQVQGKEFTRPVKQTKAVKAEELEEESEEEKAARLLKEYKDEREEAKEPEEDGLDELDKLVTNALNKPMADGFKDIVARRDAGELKIENEELSKALDELNLDDYKLNFTSDEATKDEAEAAEDETQELE